MPAAHTCTGLPPDLQLMSRGYIASAEKIRDRLLISEWELARKQVAQRRWGASRAEMGGGT